MTPIPKDKINTGKDLTTGITGGIGSGKSVVSRVLRCNGFKVFDCDMEAKMLMTQNELLKKSLQEALGKDIYHEDGTLNRQRLSDLIFTDEEKRKIVNREVHAAVSDLIMQRRKETEGLFFIESAILASSGLLEFCDAVWLVVSDEKIRLKRLEEREPGRAEEMKKRIETQKAEQYLLKHDMLEVLVNNVESRLLERILKLIDKFKQTQTYTIPC